MTNVDASRASDRRVRRPLTPRLVKGAFVLNLVVVVALFAHAGGFSGLTTTPAILTALGRLAGLLGVNLCLVQLVLMGRTPFLDRIFGMDRLARWHRWVGHTSFDLIVLHVVLLVVGYADMSHLPVLSEVPHMILGVRDMLMATVAFGLLVAIVLTSIRIARKRMRYESWYFVHMYAYAAVALAVPHQIYAGTDFAQHLASQIYWATFYAFAVGAVLLFRFVLPVVNMMRYGLRVAGVVEENAEVVSIYLEGRNLDRLRAEAGQFFIWRFLCRGQWWQAHPYSLSAASPWEMRNQRRRRQWLRISVKDLGRGSGELIDLPVGTRVVAEGPFGTFTARNRSQRRVLLVAGGIGVTPIRALLESVPARHGDITVVYRVSSEEELVFMDEIEKIARRRGARVVPVVGRRSDFPRNRQPLSPGHLRSIVPQVEEHDVYICGPEQLTERVRRALDHLGLESHQVHYESFAF